MLCPSPVSHNALYSGHTLYIPEILLTLKSDTSHECKYTYAFYLISMLTTLKLKDVYE